jgi:spore germination protein YaaH
MSTRTKVGLLTAAVLLATPASTAAAASCHGQRPSKLRLTRALGSTVARLSWHAPERARRHLAYRVLRNGHVVAQTHRRALRLGVRLGHVQRFAVVPLTGRGRASRCVASARIKVSYHNPGTPLDLVVTGGEGGLRVSWRRGARGDGRLAGYRLLRDGAMVGQTAATSWALAGAANRSYRFAVAAVDSRGHASRPSKAVTIVTGHTPPAPPVGVTILPVSDSAIGVTWTPTRVDAGRVVGYRVLRDGLIARQVAGTSYVLSNLAPSTDYRIAVVAVDSLGYASAPSNAVVARTQDPVPTTGRAQAFLLASTYASFADFMTHYRQIGVVYPTYFDCTGGGALAGVDDPLVTQWAQARQVKVLPRVNCQRTAVVHQILTDPGTRSAWLDRLTTLVADQGYDGISIDFEAGPASDRAALSSFIDALAARLHADGKLLSICVSPKVRESFTHPRNGIFDYAHLAQAADWVFVMAWGLHWATSGPGAQDDATWTHQVADYVATMPNPSKFAYGTNLYAMDWPSGGGASHPATAYEYDDIVPRLPSLGASVVLDPASDAYHATYTDAGGAPHDVWYPDQGTIGHRIRVAQQDGLGAVGFWRLGREDQRVWDDPLLAPGADW